MRGHRGKKRLGIPSERARHKEARWAGGKDAAKSFAWATRSFRGAEWSTLCRFYSHDSLNSAIAGLPPSTCDDLAPPAASSSLMATQQEEYPFLLGNFTHSVYKTKKKKETTPKICILIRKLLNGSCCKTSGSETEFVTMQAFAHTCAPYTLLSFSFTVGVKFLVNLQLLSISTSTSNCSSFSQCILTATQRKAGKEWNLVIKWSKQSLETIKLKPCHLCHHSRHQDILVIHEQEMWSYPLWGLLCHLGECFWMRLTFKWTYFEESPLPSLAWMGLIQSLEGQTEQKSGLPGQEQILQQVAFWLALHHWLSWVMSLPAHSRDSGLPSLQSA